MKKGLPLGKPFQLVWIATNHYHTATSRVPEQLFTKLFHHFVAGLCSRNLRRRDRTQVQINFSCDAVASIDPYVYKGSTECQRVTGVEVNAYTNSSTGQTSRVANLNIDVEID